MANETGAYQVTSHLADVHGYTDISFTAGPPDSPDSASRRIAGQIIADGRVPFRAAAAGDGLFELVFDIPMPDVSFLELVP